MRVIVFMVGVIVALTWIGIEIRSKNRPASNVMLAFAVLFAVLLVGAAYDLL